ncbi:MAG: hypothetical protein EPO61_04000 [Nitrospirae bacterium]|nr:MAG: hypothetical protein EPO61_04000 [Nitrospirota bacterium]
MPCESERGAGGGHRSALGPAFSMLMLVGLWAGLSGSALAQDLVWDQVLDGVEAAVWTPGPRCQDDVPPVYVVRADPAKVRFSTYHFRQEQLAEPLTIQEWHRRTRASVLFNAGLFRENFAYLGLLFKDGRSLGSKRHPQWLGLFVAEPLDPGLRKARVLDLTVDPFSETQPAYLEAAQSLMLLDRTGKIRVRQSGKRAYQTVVGEDGAGQILVMKTVEPAGLWALADCLRSDYPAVRQAMAMDGGSSSDLLIGEELLAGAEPRSGPRSWEALVEGGKGEHIPLPAVIGLVPRK